MWRRWSVQSPRRSRRGWLRYCWQRCRSVPRPPAQFEREVRRLHRSRCSPSQTKRRFVASARNNLAKALHVSLDRIELAPAKVCSNTDRIDNDAEVTGLDVRVALRHVHFVSAITQVSNEVGTDKTVAAKDSEACHSR